MNISALICNNNVIHLTKHCNLVAVSLHREFETKTLFINQKNEYENYFQKFGTCSGPY